MKAVKSFYKGGYFIIVVTWGYLILKNEYFMPASLLGNGDLNNLEAQFPNYQWPSTLKYYYLTTMGFHLYQCI